MLSNNIDILSVGKCAVSGEIEAVGGEFRYEFAEEFLDNACDKHPC